MEKNIVNFLYEANSIPKLLKDYENYLRTSTELDDLLHANKINEYYNIVVDTVFLSILREQFNNIYDFIETDYPTLKFFMEGRRKAVISSEAKIKLYLEKNKSLDELRDFYAFRITLLEKSSLNLIETCYELMKKIINFMIKQGFNPCEATETIDTNNFVNEMNILIPKKTYFDEKYKHLVKDYIFNPKHNGYQSLHVVFRDSIGRTFEVQIRTLDMHILAEISNVAGHDFYKENRYLNTHIEFEREKIHIDGYKYINDHLFDYVGLENGLRILQRQKTF